MVLAYHLLGLAFYTLGASFYGLQIWLLVRKERNRSKDL